MRIRVVGENDCARALRGLLRQADFAVTECVLAHSLLRIVGGAYVIHIEEAAGEHILFDSVDCELEAAILRHVTQLSPHRVLLDRPGGQIHSDQEIHIVVPRGNEAEAVAVEFGVLRGLLDIVGIRKPWYRRIFGDKP